MVSEKKQIGSYLIDLIPTSKSRGFHNPNGTTSKPAKKPASYAVHRPWPATQLACAPYQEMVQQGRAKTCKKALLPT